MPESILFLGAAVSVMISLMIFTFLFMKYFCHISIIFRLVQPFLQFPEHIQEMMGNTHHIGALADDEMVLQIQLEERIIHIIDGGAHIVGCHIGAHKMQPLRIEILHQGVDILDSVKLEQLSRVR